MSNYVPLTSIAGTSRDSPRFAQSEFGATALNAAHMVLALSSEAPDRNLRGPESKEENPCSQRFCGLQKRVENPRCS